MYIYIYIYIYIYVYIILVLIGRDGGLSTLSFILSGIVKEQHVLTPFNFFFKFSHSLTLFPIFWLHENWAVCYVTENLFKICYYAIYVT